MKRGSSLVEICLAVQINLYTVKTKQKVRGKGLEMAQLVRAPTVQTQKPEFKFIIHIKSHVWLCTYLQPQHWEVCGVIGTAETELLGPIDYQPNSEFSEKLSQKKKVDYNRTGTRDIPPLAPTQANRQVHSTYTEITQTSVILTNKMIENSSPG